MRSKKREQVCTHVADILGKRGFNVFDYDRDVIGALIDVVGQTLGVHQLTGGEPPPEDYRRWLSARLRDLAGDIDDGFYPGGKSPGTPTYCWMPLSDVVLGDRVIDYEDAQEMYRELHGDPPPGCVLVRRWKREGN